MLVSQSSPNSSLTTGLLGGQYTNSCWYLKLQTHPFLTNSYPNSGLANVKVFCVMSQILLSRLYPNSSNTMGLLGFQSINSYWYSYIISILNR